MAMTGPDTYPIVEQTMDNYILNGKGLTLRGSETGLSDIDTATFLGVRQQQLAVVYETRMKLQGEAGCGGITVFHTAEHHYDLCARRRENGVCLWLRKQVADILWESELTVIPDGEELVLLAQAAGLNTCWVALCSRRKNKAQLAQGEKVRIVIAVGYGKTQGAARKTKPVEELATIECAETPDWFATAMEAAQLAPTAMNNQNFLVTLLADGRTVRIKAPSGGWNMVDLGIVRRNFQEAADACGADWRWEGR